MSDLRPGGLFPGSGAPYAIAAYGIWGIAPVYFKLVGFATPFEIIAHRIVWSVVILFSVVLVRRQFYALRHLPWSRVGWLGVSGTLVSINWCVFVWALLNERMLETSLGYYINPLVNVLLGMLFLGERLRIGQAFAVMLATAGVVNEVVSLGSLPWVGLTLAVTFGLYGLVRKKLAVDSIIGLGVETTLLLPLALGYLILQFLSGEGAILRGMPAEIGLLGLGGLVTVIPLACFAAAAMRMPLVMLGFFQYLAPTLTLLLAVFVYHEPFRPSQVITFGCIWLALMMFSGEGLYHQLRKRKRLIEGDAG